MLPFLTKQAHYYYMKFGPRLLACSLILFVAGAMYQNYHRNQEAKRTTTLLEEAQKAAG